ncbi:lsm8 [[Candida] subhashii]|uniref:LSM2-LSM8 complex subunit LSM8 n=1 Tax=[Candida] subhashii TaxID=561895 RepID=A0A8J5QQ21_9ASCO|nr:lsm8 [[Candida] subhashii]KAG7664358.1 lsm8 [[Candida] subhashii]
MSDLKTFLEIQVITSDARFFEGTLQGYDKSTNIILGNCIERILYSEEENEDNQVIPLGVYIMRGGEIVCIGEVDEDKYKSIDWMMIKAEPLKGTKNPL